MQGKALSVPCSRRLLRLVGAVTVGMTACGPSSAGPSSTAAGGQTIDPATANAGGDIRLGVWQEPLSFLDAGIVDGQTFSYIVDAPVQEGLLWYRSTIDTHNAKTLADYWAPDLATEVPTVANGDVKTSGCADVSARMCVTWKLRQGVQWQDGSKFTSHDVCDTVQFWWTRYGTNNPTALLSTVGWDQMQGCNEDNPYQATVNFKSQLGSYLSFLTGVYGVLPSSLLDKAFAAGASDPKQANLQAFKFSVDLSAGSRNPAAYKTPPGGQTMDLFMDGTGPYVFQSYSPGKQWKMVRNNNYWNKAHLPHLDSVTVKVVTDLTAEVNAIKAGDIDMGFDYRLYNLNTLTQESANGRIRIQRIPDSGAEKVDMNLCDQAKGLCGDVGSHPFTGDLTIRKAILMALNRQEIVQNQAEGQATIPHDAWQYLGADYALDPSTNPITAYSPDAAHTLLDQAGYRQDPSCGSDAADGGSYRRSPAGCIAINLGTTTNNPSRVQTESLVQSYLARVGILVKTPFTPNLVSNAFFGSFSSGGPLYTHNFDMAMYTSALGSPAEFDNYYADYHADCGGACPDKNNIPSVANKGNGQNNTAEDNPIIDQNLDLGQTTVDLDVRAQAYQRIEAQLARDLPEIPLYQQVTVDAYSVKLQKLEDNGILWDFNVRDWYCTGGSCQA